MKNSKLSVVEQPEPIELDPLSALLRSGARALIAQAVEAELEVLLHSNIKIYV